MIQTLKKLCQTDNLCLRELLMKHIGLFCCSAVLIGAGAVYASYGHERVRAMVYAAGAILASFMALIQWASGRRVKRAELVDRLIEKIETIDPNSLTEECESVDVKEREKEREKHDQEFIAKLSFLSYIAYLQATGILSEDEFNALRLDLVRILEHEKVVGMIEEACNGSKGSKYIPYSYLVRYGVTNCEPKSAGRYKAILDKKILVPQNAQMHKEMDRDKSEAVENAGQNKGLSKRGGDDTGSGKEEVIDSVTSGKTYDTHVEVLNGIFKFSYRAHMRGCATLPDGRVVWFPKYYDSMRQVPIKVPSTEWVNILDSEKGVLSEYWPLGVEMTDERLNRWNKTPRYVFGMDKSGSPWVYRFLGIYQFARREENHLVYTRQCEVLRRGEVENSLNPDNC